MKTEIESKERKEKKKIIEWLRERKQIIKYLSKMLQYCHKSKMVL